MRKALAALVAFAFAFLAVSVPVVSAQSEEPTYLQCNMEIDVVFANPAYWVGTLDGVFEGATIQFVEGPSHWLSNVAHFTEVFTITTKEGDVITGFDEGLYNLNMFKFRANGFVTDVTGGSGDWAFLVGYHFHEMGVTTPFNPPNPVHGTATMTLVAP